jgi:ATP-binding cassette subfamily F protein 3
MRVNNLTFGYNPDRILINGLSIDIDKTDRICVIGKNGKGKSTLLRLLAGELEPNEGTVKAHPECSMGYFGQTNIERLDTSLTIEKEMGRVRPDLKYGEIRRACGAMMFTGDLALKEISILSGGEKSRVSLGKILLNPANLLLLDEPTNHLDMESCDSMIVALDEFPGAVIIVTHSEAFLHHLANRLIIFNEDKVFVFEGTYQDFLDKVGWEEDVKKPKKKAVEPPTDKQRDEDMSEAKQRKSLAVRITTIEKAIDESETLLEASNLKLAEAYAKPDGADTRAIQAECEDHQKVLDEGYKKLEVLIAEMDVLEKKQSDVK